MENEFKNLMKEYLAYSSETHEAENSKGVSLLSGLMNVPSYVIMNWVGGTNIPSEQEERRMVSILRRIKSYNSEDI